MADPPDAQVASTDQLRPWYQYNWAVHAWATPVAAVLIGPWMLALADHAVGDKGVLLSLGPLHLRAAAYPSAMITVAALLQLAVLPRLGVAADAREAKRRWLGWACWVGSMLCVALAFTGGSEWLLAGLLFLAGSLISGISDLTWNAMLPELGAPEDRDVVSGRGSALGYLGGGTILLVNLVLVDLHPAIGISKADAVRICFAVAGVWWAAFGWWALRRLHPVARPGRTGVVLGVRETFAATRKTPHARRYLVSYLLFGDGMSAVISLASTFLTHELFHNNTTKATPFLFELILAIQFVSMIGALLSGRVARRVGAKRTLAVALVVWTLIIVYCYAILHSEATAWIAGMGIGVVLGASAALARSLFSQMIPAGAEATWFGLYEVCSQGTAWIAPLLFTIVVNATGSFRQAILSLIALFVSGLIVLLTVDPDAAAAETASVGK